MGVDQQHAEVAQRAMARLRQLQAPANAVTLLVGSGNHVERERDILRAARHRPHHRQAVAGRRQCRLSREGVATPCHDAVGRLVGEHAAIVRRRTQRAADVRAELERHVAGRQRGGRAARRAARRPLDIVGIVGGAIDRIRRLPVGERHRHVGLADDHGAGGLQPLDRDGILGRPPVLEGGNAPGRRQPRDVERLLHGHRQTEQRPALAARQRLVGSDRGLACPVEVTHHHGVDGFVERLDARDGLVEQLDRRDATGSEVGHERAGGAILHGCGRLAEAPRRRGGARRGNANHESTAAGRAAPRLDRRSLHRSPSPTCVAALNRHAMMDPGRMSSKPETHHG